MKNLFIALSFFSVAAGAQQVYKCRDAVGNLHLSDTVCAIGTTGGAIEVKPNVLDGSEGRATAARQDYQRQLETRSAQGTTPKSGSLANSRECQIATKNAWGANRKEAQRQADVACLGTAGAQQAAAERKAARPIVSTCTSNGYGSSTCTTR